MKILQIFGAMKGHLCWGAIAPEYGSGAQGANTVGLGFSTAWSWSGTLEGSMSARGESRERARPRPPLGEGEELM